MAFFSTIWEGIKSFFNAVSNLVRKVIRGILNFLKEVVAWFKKLGLNKEKDTPFIVDAEKLKQMIDNAPIVDVGIFEAVYDEELQTITHARMVEADSLDQQTKDTLAQADDGLVVLN